MDSKTLSRRDKDHARITVSHHNLREPRSTARAKTSVRLKAGRLETKVSGSTLSNNRKSISGDARPTKNSGEIAASEVPAPIAEGTSSPPPYKQPHSTLVVSLRPVSSSSTSGLASTYALTQSHLTSATRQEFSQPTVTTSLASLPSITHTPAHAPPHASSRPPVTVIVLIAVGIACLAIGGILFLKCGVLKRRRIIPVPSAPILQDSPLFGGKERFSGRLWPSYSNLVSSASTRFSASNKAGVGSGNDGWKRLPDQSRGLNVQNGTKKTEEKGYDVNLRPNIRNSIFASPTSIYPDTQSEKVGLAIDTPPLPVPGPPVKPLRIRIKKEVIHKRQSTMNVGDINASDMAKAFNHPRPAPTPAGGSAPNGLKSALKPSRERIVKPYKGLANPRGSLAPPTNIIPRIPSPVPPPELEVKGLLSSSRTESTIDPRKDFEDRKALTSALGLLTPPLPLPSSPGSIYPNHSLSAIYPASPALGLSPAPTLGGLASPSGTTIALGNLMLQEFPTSTTLVSNSALRPLELSKDKQRAHQYQYQPQASTSTITRDNPGVLPRVPSFAALPSLAQMALERADPDYRSPTYSIYGLYEAQRKSGV